MHDAGALGRRHRVLEGLAEPGSPPRIVGDPDVDPLILEARHQLEREQRVGDISAAVGAEELDREELDPPVDPGDAGRVAGDGTDGAGHVRAMAIVVLPAQDTRAIHARVAVRPGRVGVEVAREVGVSEVDAAVDDGHDHVARIGVPRAPRRRGADLHHVPLGAPERIAREHVGGADVGAHPVAPDGLRHRESARHLDHVKVRLPRQGARKPRARQEARP